MNLTTQDRSFLTALKISTDAPQLPSSYPKPEKQYSPVASSFIGGDSEPMVPLSSVEELCTRHRITEERLAECKRLLLHEEERVNNLRIDLAKSKRETEDAKGSRERWRMLCGGACFVGFVLFCALAYTWGSLAVGK